MVLPGSVATVVASYISRTFGSDGHQRAAAHEEETSLPICEVLYCQPGDVIEYHPSGQTTK